MRPAIGITTGDPAGAGPEVIRAALASGQLDERFDYRVFGPMNSAPGAPNQEGARAALAALEEAAGLARDGQLAAVVTGPIHKKRMDEIGFGFPGHTEFFADRCGVPEVTMCLTGGGLMVGLATAHLPLAEVPRALDPGLIVRTGQRLAAFAERLVGRPARIAVAGLNPHAGEEGLLGREEIEIIQPAVAELQRGASRGIFTGPHPPDTLFFRALEGEFDAVLAMYHDQGLIPLKLVGFHDGVNVTLGLPFPRTSPDHGTAFEIAGKGTARPDSMIAAIRLAAKLAATAGM
jgi:4-hydroxythreonine-4-phosphate dehydrogenase